jgi:hypothetical protein
MADLTEYGLMSSGPLAPGPAGQLAQPDIPLLRPRPSAPAPSIREQIMQGLFAPPDAARSFLSPEDIEAAQRQGMMSLGAGMLDASAPRVGGGNFGQSLARGLQAGQGAFANAIANAGELSGYAQKLQDAQDAKRAQQQMIQQRQAIISKHPPVANETPAQTAARLQAMLPEFIAANDTEMVGKVVELLKSQSDLLGNKPQNLQEVDLGDRVQLYDPRTGELVQELTKGATPKAPGQSDAQANIEFQRAFGRAKNLQDSFNKAIEKRLEAAQAIAQTLPSVPLAVAGDGAAQVEMLYSFIKAMDPTSVVREGEIALAREATPLWEWARSNVSKVENKSVVLPPEMARRMERILRKRLAGYAKYIDTKRSQHMAQAKRANLGAAASPDELFLDAETLIGVGPLGEAPAPPPGAHNPHAAPPLPDVRSLLRPPR